MIKFLFLILIPVFLAAQEKIVYTAVDYSNNEVRATICNIDGSDKTDLGFNRTYLPAWFGDKILFNSDTFIWECDTEGENLRQMIAGYRVSVSHDKKKFAFYNKEGIGIADTTGRLIKQIFVEPWEEVTVTWYRDDTKISFFNLQKDKSLFFDLKEERIEEIGTGIYHPLYHKASEKVLFNRSNGDLFDVILASANDTLVINDKKEMALVPSWSTNGNMIAYLSVKETEDTVETDMLFADLILYSIDSGKKTVLTEDASYTDQAFPQVVFDRNDEFVYFTSITEKGTGALARINIKTLKQEIISKNPNIDERIPLVKNY
jgi:hypothetical protein